MPHYCRICQRSRSNESFSGKGHRTHVCRKCQKLPKEQREAIEVRDELSNYLSQSHISDKNLQRLGQMELHPVPKLAALAQLLRKVAMATPFKRKRLRKLAADYPELLTALLASGLALPDYYFDTGCIREEYIDGESVYALQPDPDDSTDPGDQYGEIPF